MPVRRQPLSAAFPANPGDFRPDGSFWAEGNGSSSVTRFIQSLVRARRAGCSPFEIVQRIAVSEHSGCFTASIMEAWGATSERWKWAIMPVSTSAEAAIKYCGCYGKEWEALIASDSKGQPTTSYEEFKAAVK